MSRLLRSFLFVPGDRDLLLDKALSAGADAVVVDLEDGVRLECKANARIKTARFLKANSATVTPIYVRINPVSTPLWRDDLAALVATPPHGVRVSKAESSAQLSELDQALCELEEKSGRVRGSMRIVPTIESASGVLAALEMAKSPRVEALCFGMADFLADIHAEPDSNFTSSLHALSQLVLCSQAAGIQPPIASVHTKLDDSEGLQASNEIYRKLGFFGRSCIHPSQLDAIHQAFTPSAEAVARALLKVQEFERWESESSTAAISHGEFVDEAVVRRARAVLSLAQQLEAQREQSSR